MMKKDGRHIESRSGSPRKSGGKGRKRILPTVFLCAALVLLSACGGNKTVQDNTAVAGATDDFSTDDLSSDSISIDDSDFASTIGETAPEAVETPEASTAESFSAMGKDITIVLDPGHSSQVTEGTEPIGPEATETKVKDTIGVLGKSSSTYEYDLTMNVTKKLRTELENRGYKVVLTHADTILPISNAERAAVANDNKADAFIRIFANYSEDTTAHGATAVCITDKNPYHPEMFNASFRLADVILNTFCNQTGAKLERIWMTDTMTGNNWSKVPTALIQLGYMSNPDEDLNMNMDSYRLDMAAAIANGIDRWFAEMPDSEKSTHAAFNTGASGNESAAVSDTSVASVSTPAATAPSSTTPASTTAGNDPENPVGTIPVTATADPSTVVPAGTTTPAGTQTVTTPGDINTAAETGTPTGTQTVTDPSTVTTTSDINNAAEVGTPSNTTTTTPGTSTNTTTTTTPTTPTTPPLSPAPGADGTIDETEYLYFVDDNAPAYNGGPEENSTDISFENGEDDTSYSGGDLTE